MGTSDGTANTRQPAASADATPLGESSSAKQSPGSHADQLGREQVRLGVGLGGGHVLGAHQHVEPHAGAGQHGVHEAALRRGHQRVRQAGRRDLGEQFARAGPDRHAAAADPLDDVTT